MKRRCFSLACAASFQNNRLGSLRASVAWYMPGCTAAAEAVAIVAGVVDGMLLYNWIGRLPLKYPPQSYLI